MSAGESINIPANTPHYFWKDCAFSKPRGASGYRFQELLKDTSCTTSV